MTERPVRVLLTSNIVLPAVSEELGLSVTPFGGWLTSMTQRLAACGDLAIGVAMRANVRKLRVVEKDGVTYFALPQRAHREMDVRPADCIEVLSTFEPDILHVQGTEMVYAARFVEAWSGPTIVALQGVLNGYARYELGRLPIAEMANVRYPRVALSALAQRVNRIVRFHPRLRHERLILAAANHVLGRTLWDRAQADALSPGAVYHHCPEILRDEFHEFDWQSGACERHAIFIGNASSPRKGAHIAIQAIALLRKDFPGIRLYIAGDDPRGLPITSLKRQLGYSVYLLHLIDRLGLERHVEFTGLLGASDMARRMASSHAYLLPSLIENSPNTLGEAMMMGVPVVTAYTGGVPSLAVDEREALFYRADDPVMLAWQMRRLFEDPELAARLSAAARARARINHDPERALAALLGAYAAVTSSEASRK